MKKLSLTLILISLFSFSSQTMAGYISQYCCYSEDADHANLTWMFSADNGEIQKVTLFESTTHEVLLEDDIVSTGITRGIKSMRNHKGNVTLKRHMDNGDLTFGLKTSYNSTVIENTRLICETRRKCSID